MARRCHSTSRKSASCRRRRRRRPGTTTAALHTPTLRTATLRTARHSAQPQQNPLRHRRLYQRRAPWSEEGIRSISKILLLSRERITRPVRCLGSQAVSLGWSNPQCRDVPHQRAWCGQIRHGSLAPAAVVVTARAAEEDAISFSCRVPRRGRAEVALFH